MATPEAALAALRGRPGWADLTAVREGRVVPYLADIVTTRPGPRFVEGLEALARAIHPELFE
jgi:iron complex transport system substrate-binding protein